MLPKKIYLQSSDIQRWCASNFDFRNVTCFDLPSSVFLHEFTGPLEAVVKYDCDNEHTSLTSNTAITEMQMRKNMFVVKGKFHHRNPNCHQKSSNQGILKRQILFLSFTLLTLFIFYIGINHNAINFDFQFDYITFWNLFGYCSKRVFIKLGYAYHFTILYVCDKISFNVTNNSPFLSISCFIWLCVLIFLVSRLIFLRNNTEWYKYEDDQTRTRKNICLLVAPLTNTFFLS